jgi:hypothetical protein
MSSWNDKPIDPEPSRRRRSFKPAPASAPTTLQEISRRYYACAVQLAKVMGLPLTEAFLREHRESISCCFIESGRAGVRLPAGAVLPPLAPPAAASVPGATVHPSAPTPAVDVAPSNGAAAPEPPADPGAGEILCSGMPPDPEAEAPKLSLDQARQLKQLAGLAFGYPEGEQRLRADLGFEPGESLRLRHLCKHVTPVQARPLLEAYAAVIRAQGNGHGP